MNNLKLNETPVRTTRSSNINNIKLGNVNIPEKINKFNNLEILGKNTKITIQENKNK